MKTYKKPKKAKEATSPTAEIPDREAWVYRNPMVIGAIRKGLEDALSGRFIRVDNGNDFFKKL